jgi:hypothetical protein
MDKHDTIARKGGNVMSSQSGETHEDANAGLAGTVVLGDMTINRMGLGTIRLAQDRGAIPTMRKRCVECCAGRSSWE